MHIRTKMENKQLMQAHTCEIIPIQSFQCIQQVNKAIYCKFIDKSISYYISDQWLLCIRN